MVRELGPELAARLDPGYPRGQPGRARAGHAGGAATGSRSSEQIDVLREALGFAPEATGSNNWAVSPRRSATGGALLAGDPHLPPSMPGITYQLGLEVGGRTCRGASFPGRVGIAFGQNDDVAWSFTNTMADVMDLFVERIDGERVRVRRRAAARSSSPRRRSRSRGAPSPSGSWSALTHHGPIVNEALRADPDEPLALRWSGARRRPA